MDFNALAHTLSSGGPDVIIILCAVTSLFLSGHLHGPSEFNALKRKNDQQQALIDQVQTLEDRRIRNSELQLDLLKQMQETLTKEREEFIVQRLKWEQDKANRRRSV